jgi:hypothetical protein
VKISFLDVLAGSTFWSYLLVLTGGAVGVALKRMYSASRLDFQSHNSVYARRCDTATELRFAALMLLRMLCICSRDMWSFTAVSFPMNGNFKIQRSIINCVRSSSLAF